VLTPAQAPPPPQPAPSVQDQIRERPQSVADPRILRQPGGVIRLDEPVRLEYFERPHLMRLNDLFGNPLGDTEISQLLDLVGGQPYLTRLAFYRLGQGSGTTFVDLLQRASDDDGPFGEHLRARLSQLGRRPELSQAMAGLVSRNIPPKMAAFYRLHAAGLVRKGRDGSIIPANQIYKSFLERALT
jgi:hypothetical protein